MSTVNKNSAVLLIHCPDKKGIVADVTDFLNHNNGNIVTLDEHVDRLAKVFFMRIEWELREFQIPREKIGDFFNTLIGVKYGMTWRLYFSDKRPKMALYVSKLSHCLYDVLSRVHSGEWEVDIPLIISNHNDLEPVARQFGIPFHLFENTK